MAGQCGPDQVPPGAIALLGGAIRYALGVCALVTPAEMTRPTPCADWDLAALLAHLATPWPTWNRPCVPDRLTHGLRIPLA